MTSNKAGAEDRSGFSARGSSGLARLGMGRQCEGTEQRREKEEQLLHGGEEVRRDSQGRAGEPRRVRVGRRSGSYRQSQVVVPVRRIRPRHLAAISDLRTGFV
jgi:hypothetical protein